MCPKCDGFAERFRLYDKDEYLSIVRQLVQVVAEGTLELVRSDCPLEDMLQAPMPGDTIRHEFRCTRCGTTFQLWRDTYHGAARWISDAASYPDLNRW